MVIFAKNIFVWWSVAGGGAEHVEDWLECFRTECHRRPQQVMTQWSQCLDTDWAEPRHVCVLQSDLYLMRLQSPTRREKRRGPWRVPPTSKPSSAHHCSFRDNTWFSIFCVYGTFEHKFWQFWAHLSWQLITLLSKPYFSLLCANSVVR